MIYRLIIALAISVLATTPAFAQLAPGMGYAHPSGGAAGQTVELVLAGYDWTPDMQFFLSDDRVKVEVIGPLSEIIVPEPPYWFGKKARDRPFPLPREMPVRMTIPATVPPGVIHWQAANAAGATARGSFVISQTDELVDVRNRKEPQEISKLPVAISGQVLKIEEVDRYKFTAPATGPFTAHVVARSIGSPLSPVLEIHDTEGTLVADAADTEGQDLWLTFAGHAGKTYTASVYDVDFRGNRSFVYRLSLAAGPHVVAAIPAVGKRGTTQDVELIGYGVASGAAKLESVRRKIQFPADMKTTSLAYVLDTPHGKAAPFTIGLTDTVETLEPSGNAAKPRPLTLPASLTGVLEERFGVDRYQFDCAKGDTWDIAVEASAIGSSLDVALAVTDPEGALVKQVDDLPGTTDTGLQFKAKTDGMYTLRVSDSSGNSGSRAAVYRLLVTKPAPDFEITVPELLNVPMGGKLPLTVTVKRQGGFAEPITLSFSGLPAGIVLPEKLEVPAKRPSVRLNLECTDDVASVTQWATITGTAKMGEQEVTHTSNRFLATTVMKPVCKILPEGLDDVRKTPRGTTYPGPVLIERLDGFKGEIMLEMTSQQGRHRQGIHGPEMTVAPGVTRCLYPIFLPEWLETTRTSRMTLNSVVKIPDPKGNVRYLTTKMVYRIGFLPVGALMSLSAQPSEMRVTSGEPIDLTLSLARSPKLVEPAKLELQLSEDQQELFSATAITMTPGQDTATFRISPLVAMDRLVGEHKLTVRATVLENGHLPAISESTVLVEFVAGEK